MSKNGSLPEAKKTKQRRSGLMLKEQQAELLAFCSGDYIVTRPGQGTAAGKFDYAARFPALKSDKKAEELLGQDLADYISAEILEPFPFEYRPEQKSVNLRVPMNC